ncbi:S8 family serine peptidase [Limisalsivibrio acetivorans]|uniref:S8 family serine peptidase n=1 Tax=Limisalsivibrio acetivorans TaxID=1304888 RepID=UPI0003B55BF0|nr:S8 family serine peptidase [Limisalsivibrio acetivorans]
MDEEKIYPIYYIPYRDEFCTPLPRRGRGGKTRALNKRISRETLSEKVEKGYHYYRSFKFNRGLPVVEQILLEKGSEAKSLRQSFLKTTKARLVGSAGLRRILFSVEDEAHLGRIASMIRYSRNTDFYSSLTHFEDIGGFMPEDKRELSSLFLHRLHNAQRGDDELIKIICFSISGAEEKTADFLAGEIGAEDVRLNCLGSGIKSIYCRVPSLRDKLDVILSHSLIRNIAEQEQTTLTPQYLRREEIPVECIVKREKGKTYPVVGVFDTGVAPGSYLREWEYASHSFVECGMENNMHGTFVTGRLLQKGENFGGIMYLDINCIPDTSRRRVCFSDVAPYIECMVMKYNDRVKFWNLSMGTDEPGGRNISECAAFIDHLQYKYDVVFIIPTGNYHKLRSWDMEELKDENRLTPPADSLHGITVGSITQESTNILPALYPSLFTRRGRGACMAVKPDLVYYGGTHEMRFGRYLPRGVHSIGINNEIAEDTGTSHASPPVAAAAAELYHTLLFAGMNTDMVKALLLHRAEYPSGEDQDSCTEATRSYYGWGIPTFGDSLLCEGGDTLTFITCGRLKTGCIMEVGSITVPPELLENGKLSGRIDMTLSSKVPVNPEFPDFYTCINLEASLGFYEKGNWRSILSGKDISGMPDDEALREVYKWLPTKKYTQSFKKKKCPGILILRLSTSRRDFHEGDNEIPYGVAISFRGHGKNIHSRVCSENTVSSFTFEKTAGNY